MKVDITKWDNKEYALITGASSGMGEVFAFHLAKLGFNLILVARRESRLKTLQHQIKSIYDLDVLYFSVNLAQKDQLDAFCHQIENYTIDLLVNGAGFGTLGFFVQKPIEPELTMMDLHMKAPVELAHSILPNMIERNRGVIINIASAGAFFFQPQNLVYGPTKAFLNVFSANLQTEVDRYHIKIQSLCPGYTKTEFHEVGFFEGFDKRKISKFLWQEKEKVVSYSLKKLNSHRIYAIPGFKYRLAIYLMRKGWVRRLVSKFL